MYQSRPEGGGQGQKKTSRGTTDWVLNFSPTDWGRGAATLHSLSPAQILHGFS